MDDNQELRATDIYCGFDKCDEKDDFEVIIDPEDIRSVNSQPSINYTSYKVVEYMCCGGIV